ncbi:DUF202 domain-containing protein [Isoptericola croceus]|uniref:DUF202 domain-containing protein n=1 Tax=Isoptericola croceus TaxID=3031406 RepID=UPI0023F99F70|nr:DUF202 domain-containing protein [Isoptericola croceus]
MSETAEPPDRAEERGLAVERTALAWRRTLLSLMAVSLFAIQVVPDARGAPALASAAAVLVLTPPLWWFAKQHARHTHVQMRQEPQRLRHGRRIALICAGTGLLGLGGMILVLAF